MQCVLNAIFPGHANVKLAFQRILAARKNKQIMSPADLCNQFFHYDRLLWDGQRPLAGQHCKFLFQYAEFRFDFNFAIELFFLLDA